MIELSKADWLVLRDLLTCEAGMIQFREYKGQMLWNSPEVIELLSGIPDCKFCINKNGMIEVEDRFVLLMYFAELAYENMQEERSGIIFGTHPVADLQHYLQKQVSDYDVLE